MRDVIELLFEVVFEVLVEVFELEGLEGLEGSGLVFAPLEVLDGGFSLLDIIPGLGSVRKFNNASVRAEWNIVSVLEYYWRVICRWCR